MHYDAPPMQAHVDTNLKPGDRLIVDFFELDGMNYHVGVDAASGFIWCRDFRNKGTTEALRHYREISNLMGRFGEVHSDNGPAYRAEWNEELAKMGTDATHGAPYRPESQGAAEKAVGRIKNLIKKTGIKSGEDLQGAISALNFFSSSRPNTGSPAMRLWGRSVRGPLPAPPQALTEEQVNKLRARHAEMRDKALQRHNARPLTFQPGEHVKIWDHKQKRYAEPAVIDSPIAGDDGFPRSYKVVTEAGRLRHVTASWIVKAAAEQD